MSAFWPYQREPDTKLKSRGLLRLLRSTFTTFALLAGFGLTTQVFARDHDKLEKIEKIADKIEKVELHFNSGQIPLIWLKRADGRIAIIVNCLNSRSLHNAPARGRR